ncbi:hypothetical protein [Chitinophaga agri]|uniref:Uncharacterized protein n=1 Tax=Chitinophaga agri TaxID=2703787 RepID=A0A6B9ZB39_9BACT|nr:hypothetical protein [Chitinophaga agri]QHS58325.1 hypothetical protein GWR21_01565 [Chitinophaga agri]
MKKISPEQAEGIFRKVLDSLRGLKTAMKLGKLQLPPGIKQHITALDSMGTSLKFLGNNHALLQGSKEKLQGAVSGIQSLQQSLDNAAQIEQYIKV